MDRKVVALSVLGSALLLLIILLPPERSLGESYKFIYIHIPLSVIVLGSVIFYPLIMVALRNGLAAIAFATVTFLFSVIQILVSMLFMEFAWSGIAFHEPRMLFNTAIVVILAASVILSFIHPRLALIYSVSIPFMAAWLYHTIMSSYTFQLHPGSLVRMNAIFLLPFTVSFPFFAVLYVLVFEKIRVFLKKLSKHGQLLPQR